MSGNRLDIATVITTGLSSQTYGLSLYFLSESSQPRYAAFLSNLKPKIVQAVLWLYHMLSKGSQCLGCMGLVRFKFSD